MGKRATLVALLVLGIPLVALALTFTTIDVPGSRNTAPQGINARGDGEVLSLLDNETGMHSCLDSKPKLAGWRRRQEEASPWRREYRPRSGQARSSVSC